MAEVVRHSSRFRGARFEESDLREVRVASCSLSGARVTDSEILDVRLDGIVVGLVVNGVDVTSFVDDELDRRHPERVQVRSMRTADQHRAAWDTIEGMWAATVERARRLPAAALDESVDGEYSFAETLRHLVFATDAWFVRTVLDEPSPFAPIGVTHHSYPADDAAAIGIDRTARPSFDDVLAVRAERMTLVRDTIERVTDDELDALCDRPPAPGYPSPHSVRQCLGVVMREESDHHRYAVRDLALLEARQG